jgi:DNA (cytosine-5)-methyltransferase 1
VSDRPAPPIDFQRRPGSEPRIGSLCTGYGGLDLAVELVLGGALVWYAETDPHAPTVLAARWPDVANLGDLRTVDWSTVEPVDVLTAGFPCQDYSE